MEFSFVRDGTVPAKSHILIVSHVIPYPPAAGNEIRIYNLLSWFRSQGYTTTLVLKPLGDVEVSNQCILGLKDIVDSLYIFDNRNRISQGRSKGTGHISSRIVDADFTDPHLAAVQDGFCPEWFAAEVAEIIGATCPNVVIAQ